MMADLVWVLLHRPAGKTVICSMSVIIFSLYGF